MRRRAPRAPGTVLAAVAAAVLLSLAVTGTAGAAGHGHQRFRPSGGAPIPTSTGCTGFSPVPATGCAEAGYQASGRDFRYAQAVITVPAHQGVVTGCSPAVPRTPHQAPRACIGPRDAPPSGEEDPQLYVALDGSSAATSQYARAGVQPCAGGAPAAAAAGRLSPESKGPACRLAALVPVPDRRG